MTDHDTQQLAMYMQRRDALQFGGNTTDGTFHPQWDEIGEPGQEEYVTDAAAAIAALKALGWSDRGALEAQLAEIDRLQAVIDKGVWVADTIIEDADDINFEEDNYDAGRSLAADDIRATLASVGSSSALEAVKAAAWDEGHDAGWSALSDDVSAGWTPSGPHESDAKNPYRPVETEGESRG